MRKTLTISVPEKMYEFILEQSRFGTVSEYIRSLVRREQQQHADKAPVAVRPLRRANDYTVRKR